MKIAVVAGLTAKGDMDISASHDWGQKCRIFGLGVSFDEMKPWLCLFLMAVLFPILLFGQSGYVLRYTGPDSLQAQGQKPKQSFASRAMAEQYVQQLPALLHLRGFLAASIDSVNWEESMGKVFLYLGKPYVWKQCPCDSFTCQWLRQANGSGAGKKKSSQLNPLELRESLLKAATRSGYPFARVHIDSISFQGDSVSGRLRLEPGPLYLLDSISQKGKLKVGADFLYRHLSLSKKMPYNEDLLEAVDKKLDELPFAQRAQASEVDMFGTGGVLNVFLEPRRSNIINVLVGLMPASTQTPGNKLQLTGDVNLLLRNVFGGGETIAANWQQIQYKSPRLNLRYSQPFILRSKAGFDFQFDLFRKDTQFQNIQLNVGIPYQLNEKQTGKIFYQFQRSNLVFVDTNLIKQTRQLPDIADFSVSLLGMEWQFEHTDYAPNPRKGMQAAVIAAAGVKRNFKSDQVLGLKDPTEPSFDFASLYDSAKLNTYQMRLKGMVSHFIPLGRQATLKAALQAGWLQSGNYFRNEAFQIGGFKLLRGFDEESIYARGYGVSTMEYRYLTDKNAYLFAFVDAGLVQYSDQFQQFQNSYIGFGAGLNFETNNSRVNLSWAVGKRNDLPLDFRQSKIHLGFVNFF
jgi:outer membrane protein assembly factor BamA